MAPLRRWIFAGALGGALLVASVAGAGLALPPFGGEFSGEFAALKLSGAPTLRWTLAATPNDAQGRDLVLTIEGTGTRLIVRGAVDDAGDGRWAIEEGALDPARWFPSVANELGEFTNGVAVSGVLTLRGSGTFVRGEPRGTIAVQWRDGVVQQEVEGWTLEGVTFDGEFSIEGGGATIASTRPFELAVGTIGTTRFGARNFLARGRLQEGGRLALSEARIEVAGGEVTVDPAEIALAPLVGEVNLRITNVGLQDVAALVPAGLAETRGRINGAVRVGWREGEGFQLGQGNLVLGETESARLRLAPSPGFLTDRVSPRFELLPAWLGPIAKWVRPKNPAYADLRDIELGFTDLRLEGLSVQLTPAGDGEGRTARVRVRARPLKPGGVVEQVTFEVNVAGPLSEVVRLGLNQSFSVETR